MAGASTGGRGIERWLAGYGGRPAGIFKLEVCQVADAGRFCFRPRPAAYFDGKVVEDRSAETICGVEVAGVERNEISATNKPPPFPDISDIGTGSSITGAQTALLLTSNRHA